MDRVLQVELRYELGEVVGVVVHVIAVPGLARAAVAPAIVSDASVSFGSQEEHLVFESIRGERPAMAEDHGLPFAPILVIDLRAIFGGDKGHGMLSFLTGGGQRRRRLPNGESRRRR